MSRDYLKQLREESRQRARVRYIRENAHTFVTLVFAKTQRWDDAIAGAIDMAGRTFDALPEMPEEGGTASEAPVPASNHCPKCDSPDPGRHPAMQAGGEVQPCSHPFHGAGR